MVGHIDNFLPDSRTKDHLKVGTNTRCVSTCCRMFHNWRFINHVGTHSIATGWPVNCTLVATGTAVLSIDLVSMHIPLEHKVLVADEHWQLSATQLCSPRTCCHMLHSCWSHLKCLYNSRCSKLSRRNTNCHIDQRRGYAGRNVSTANPTYKNAEYDRSPLWSSRFRTRRIRSMYNLSMCFSTCAANYNITQLQYRCFQPGRLQVSVWISLVNILPRNFTGTRLMWRF